MEWLGARLRPAPARPVSWTLTRDFLCDIEVLSGSVTEFFFFFDGLCLEFLIGCLALLRADLCIAVGLCDGMGWGFRGLVWDSEREGVGLVLRLVPCVGCVVGMWACDWDIGYLEK